MASTKLIFNVDEVERLRTKIGQVSQDTNLLYMQLKGQANNWGGIPLGQDLVQAQVLINELTVEAEKLEDIIRQAIKGVQGLQEENKRQASQLTQQFSLFTGMFGSFGGNGSQGRFSVPSFAQKAATKLISTIATLMGRDELDKDPAVEKLRDILQKSGFGTIEGIAAQSKLNDIYEARNLIAKAQTAYEVYQAFGNQTQMDAMHKLAEDARKRLESLGVSKVQYEGGKDLSAHFKQPAVKACDYDPSIRTSSVPLVQNEAYQLLLRTAMEKGDKGNWAKEQLEGIHATMKQMIATGVNLGVHVMANQGAEAWGDVAKLTSSIAQLGRYNLFVNKESDENKNDPEKSKNAFFKSLDSFKEIGTGFVDRLRARADQATDSPYDFFNWLTLGITGDLPTAVYEGAKDRSDHMFDSTEKFADWLTLGTVEMAKGAFNPEEAWSADHWLNSLGMVTLLYGPVEESLLSTGGGILKPKLPKGPVQEFKFPGQSPQFSTNEGLQFRIDDIQTDTKSLPKTPVQINFDNEMEILRKEKGGGIFEGTGKKIGKLELSDFTEEIMATKPKYARIPEKWYAKGGHISIDEKGVWTYTNKSGISISYPDGFPDFSKYYHPNVEPVKIEYTQPKNYPKDYEAANTEAGLSKSSNPSVPEKNKPPEGYTWHHYQDGKTMVLVEKDIHDEFKHMGGQSIVNGTGGD